MKNFVFKIIVFAMAFCVNGCGGDIETNRSEALTKEDKIALRERKKSFSLEKQLEQKYIPIIQMTMKMSGSQAKTTFNNILKQIKEESENDGTSDMPMNFGDILLKNEAGNKEINAMLAKKRKEGVNNRDIKWWWNRHDFERRIILKIDDINRVALFTKLVKHDDFSEETADKKVRKHYPIFGNPGSASHVGEEDKPLPFELKNRVDLYIKRATQMEPEQFKNRLEESSSFNSLIRREIEKGRL